jgi:hypothetical protein
VSSKADEGYWREKAYAFDAGRVRPGGSIHVGVYSRTRPKYLGDCYRALPLSRMREMSLNSRNFVFTLRRLRQSLAGASNAMPGVLEVLLFLHYDVCSVFELCLVLLCVRRCLLTFWHPSFTFKF